MMSDQMLHINNMPDSTHNKNKTIHSKNIPFLFVCKGFQTNGQLSPSFRSTKKRKPHSGRHVQKDVAGDVMLL